MNAGFDVVFLDFHPVIRRGEGELGHDFLQWC
jgi:hypothetical protein